VLLLEGVSADLFWGMVDTSEAAKGEEASVSGMWVGIGGVGTSGYGSGKYMIEGLTVWGCRILVDANRG